MSQIIIGYTTEGNTDVRFLESIIERTFIEIGFDCNSQIEVLTPIVRINKELGINFNDQIKNGATQAYSKGVMAFCVHVDSDNVNDVDVYQNKVEPAFHSVLNTPDYHLCCKNLVAVVPVQMTESWMLADKQLLKNEIGTDMTDNELEINRHPESFANPKSAIENAIRIARSQVGKRRRRQLSIGELYQPIGQKISLDCLQTLNSYIKFKESVRGAYRQLNYLA